MQGFNSVHSSWGERVALLSISSKTCPGPRIETETDEVLPISTVEIMGLIERLDSTMIDGPQGVTRQRSAGYELAKSHLDLTSVLASTLGQGQRDQPKSKDSNAYNGHFDSTFRLSWVALSVS